MITPWSRSTGLASSGGQLRLMAGLGSLVLVGSLPRGGVSIKMLVVTASLTTNINMSEKVFEQSIR